MLQAIKSHFWAFLAGFFNRTLLCIIGLVYALLYSAQDGLIYHPRTYSGRYGNYYMKVRQAAKKQLALVNGGVLKEVSYKVPGVGRQTAYWLHSPERIH